MTTRSESLLLWSPRILGMLLAIFVGLFALDSFDQNLPLSRMLVGFAIHLIPALLLATLVAASWRYPWVGGVGFIVLAAAYVAMAWRRLDWILIVAGPMLTVGVLFLWIWYSSCRIPGNTPPDAPGNFPRAAE